MSDRRNVVLRFVGYTDSAPLTGRTERIYGTHIGMSSARALRVAQVVQEALDLPAAAVESDGRGTERPLGSNETVQGRALNRRVEIEFWYDDPLQQLPGEPQICPIEGDGTLVTRGQKRNRWLIAGCRVRERWAWARCRKMVTETMVPWVIASRAMTWPHQGRGKSPSSIGVSSSVLPQSGRALGFRSRKRSYWTVKRKDKFAASADWRPSHDLLELRCRRPYHFSSHLTSRR
jgi:hypothetical protein